MEFVPCDPIQTVAALLLVDVDVQWQLTRLQQRAAVFAELGVSAGDGWLFIQGLPDPEHQDEFLLPSLSSSLALYQAEKDIYCVVGWRLAAPENLASSLLLELKKRTSTQDIMILYPTSCRHLDVFNAAKTVPLRVIDVEQVTNAIVAG